MTSIENNKLPQALGEHFSNEPGLGVVRVQLSTGLPFLPRPAVLEVAEMVCEPIHKPKEYGNINIM